MSQRVSFALGLAFCAALSAPAEAQRQSCDFENYGPGQYFGAGTANEIGFFGGGVRLTCDGGTVIVADSAVRTVMSNRLDFINNVRYTDSLRTLTSQVLQYLGQDRLVVATGDVMLTDRKTGSTLRGPFLSYYLKTDTRQEEILQMPQGRPRAVLIRRVAADTLRRDTTLVDANMIEIIGENRFVGRGQVEITRGAARAFGNEVQYAEQSNILRLTGTARVVTEEYTLRGDTVIAEGTEGDEFRELQSLGTAMLESQELNVTGTGIRIYLEEGEVNRLIALGDTAADSRRAIALSPDFRLEADSIDALAPARLLDEVHAVGSARGERLVPDSIASQRPELIRYDWVRGDTIIARFTDPPPPATPADTAGPDRVLKSLDAMGVTGRPASSLYRMRDGEGENAGWAVNYMIARRIAVQLVDGEVTTVEADEAVHGLYLRPPEGRSTGAASGTPPRGTGRR